MERLIYLARHGRPCLPEGGCICFGRNSDPHLSPTGVIESQKLAECFSGISRVYCSPLKRTIETARIIASSEESIKVLPGLTEIDVGEWEGKSFDEIRKEYPDVYQARGRDWSIPPVGGESLSSAADRMQKTIMELAMTEGEDFVAITSDGAIRALLWRLLHLDTRGEAMLRSPYGSITVLRYENGALQVMSYGRLPEDSPSDDEIDEIWDLCGTPQDVREHCRAVAETCLEMRDELMATGIELSYGRLRTAALLHDTCRATGRPHAEYASNLLRERGYLVIAKLIKMHHDGNDTEKLDESQLVYLADKLVAGTSRVTLEERFAKSESKCNTPEAVEKHDQRKERAFAVKNKFEKATRRQLY